MMWATRRQLSGVVKYCCPISCCPENTSHRRNSDLSRPSLWHVSRPVTSACVDDFPIREAWHGVGVDDPFDVGGGIDRRELAGTPQICGDHLADAAREFAFGRAVAEKVGNGDRHRLD